MAVGLPEPDRQAFKQHARPDGGTLWLDDARDTHVLFRLPLLAVQQSWLDSRASAPALGPFTLTLGYTQHRLPNGACSIERHVPCASLTAGLASHLLRLCAFVARHEAVFTDLPSEGALSPLPRAGLPWFESNADDDDALIYELAEPDITAAPFRARLALVLLLDVLHIAFSHEVAHLFCGHAGYLAGKYGRLRMSEHVPPASAPPDPLLPDYQAMEFDADHYAMRLVTDLVLKELDPFAQKLAPELSRDQRLGLLLIAGCLLTLAWSALADREGKPVRLHPPPFVRYYALITGHSQMCEDRALEPPDIRRIQRWAFSNFSAMTATDRLFRPLAVFGSDAKAFANAEDKAERLQQRFFDLEDQLAPYRFVHEHGPAAS